MSTPIFYENGLWKKKCAVCPNFITHKYKSQLRQRTCSHSCQLKGNQYRKGKLSPTSFKKGHGLGDKNHKWVGDKISYGALHDWVRYHLDRPQQCENCGTKRKTKYEWANISGKYLRDLTDWVRLCKMCHVLIDNSNRGLPHIAI